jgi:hypothetical protein
MSNWDEPVELGEDLDLWEQQSGESDEHFGLFRMYLELMPQADEGSGEVLPRRISDVYGRAPVGDRQVKRIARRFRWEERARARDLSDGQSLRGKLEHRRLVVLDNRIRQVGQVSELLLRVMEGMAEDVTGWKPRDFFVAWEALVRVEDGLLGLTRLGGPGQVGGAQAVAGARAEVMVSGGDSLDARTMELAAELRRRAELGAGEGSGREGV